MSNFTSLAIDHATTRKALRRRWQWTLGKLALGALLLAPAITLGPERLASSTKGDEVPWLFFVLLILSMIVAPILLILSLPGVVGNLLVRRTLRRYPWVEANAYYYSNMSQWGSTFILWGTTAGGDQLLVLPTPGNLARDTALRTLTPGKVRIAVGNKGWGVASPAAGTILVLVRRPPTGSRAYRRAAATVQYPR